MKPLKNVFSWYFQISPPASPIPPTVQIFELIAFKEIEIIILFIKDSMGNWQLHYSKHFSKKRKCVSIEFFCFSYFGGKAKTPQRFTHQGVRVKTNV